MSEAQEAGEGFFNHLPDFFQNHQIQSWFRLTKAGLFVHEDAAEPLVNAYQAWTKKASPTGEGKTVEKCRKRIFGSEDRDLVYVLDGNRVLPGVVLAGEQPDPKKSRIPVYQANLLDSREFLHPKDPYLATLENPKSRMSSHEGFLLEFQLGKSKVDVSESGLREFAAALRANPRERRARPEITKALRYAIAPVAKFLSDAREVPQNQRLLVPIKYRGKPGIKFYRSHGMYLVLENEKRLVGCFSTKGKSLGRFIRTEIESMKDEMRGFAPGSPKKHCIGKTFSQGIAFHLHIRALLHFLRQAPNVPKVAEKLPRQFSVRDLLERFASIFRNTQPEDERNLLGKLRRREAFAKYRRTGNWVFVVVEKNIVGGCVHLRERDSGGKSGVIRK